MRVAWHETYRRPSRVGKPSGFMVVRRAAGVRFRTTEHCGVADSASGKARLQADNLVPEPSLPSGNWRTAWRVVAMVEFDLGGVCPRVAFIVTNVAALFRAVLRF